LPRLEDIERSKPACHICGAKAGFAAGIGKNERDLFLMEPDIHGYGDHAGPPDTVKDLQVLATILHGYTDAAATR
jgi:hypothetical protein